MKTRYLLLGLALLSWPLPAADPAAVAAALKLPVDAARYPQAGAVVLLDETVMTMDPQGRITREGHRLIKILQDRALRELSDQKIPFRGDAERCEIIKAATHQPSGATLEPEASGIMEVSDPEAAAAPFYSKARLKVISYPGVQIGSVIELNYRVQPVPEDPGEVEPFMGQMGFGGTEPVLEQSLTLRVPTDTGLKYEMFNGCPAPSVSTAGAMTQYTWVARDQPQILPERGMVPMEELVPRMVWTLAPDRAQLGRWLFERFTAAAEPDAAVRAKAKALTASLSGPEAKVARLALFVTKEISNVPLGLGRVGYRPTPAPVILANRYADIRDKFTLFSSLLRACGLEAQPVFVQELRARMSGLACLDEYQGLLARVSLPSGERFYDLSQNLARLGELLPGSAGRPALLVSAAGGQVITTPAVDERSQFVHARWDLALDAGGDLAGRVTLEFGGLFDHEIRRLLFGRNEEERQVIFQGAADGIRKGARMESFQVTDLLDLSRPPVVTMAVRFPEFGCRQGDMMILNLPADLIPFSETPVQPSLPSVKHPFLVPATFGMESSLSLKLPDGYRVAYQPRTAKVEQGCFAFKIACEPRSTGLWLKRSVLWRDAVVAPDAYPALWRANGQTTVPGNALILLEKL